MSRALRHTAFTLAELVVAMSLTVMVSSATVVMLRSSSASAGRVGRQMALQQRARRASDAIVTALRNGYRGDGEQARLLGADAWSEDDLPADRIRFYTLSRRPVRPGEPESDVQECEFLLLQAEGEPRASLMQRLDPTWSEPPDDGGVLMQVCPDVVALDLAYHDGTAWVPEWTEQREGWPLAVRVRMVIEPPDPPRQTWVVNRIVTFPRRPGQDTSLLDLADPADDGDGETESIPAEPSYDSPEPPAEATP